MAEAYDRHATPYHARMVDRLLDLAALRPTDRVLDLGCGPGNLAFAAAHHVPRGSVTGIDLAEGMVNFATAKAGKLGLSNVRFHAMDGRRLDLEPSRFEGVLSSFGIPLYGHARCFSEAWRVLRDGGRFAFCEWSGKGTDVGRAFFDTMATFRPRRLPEEVHQLLDARRVLRETGEPAEMSQPEVVARKLAALGFWDVRTSTETHRVLFPSPDAYIARMTAWGDNEREFRALTPSARDAFRRDFAERVAPFVTEHGLAVTQEVNYFSARK